MCKFCLVVSNIFTFKAKIAYFSSIVSRFWMHVPQVVEVKISVFVFVPLIFSQAYACCLQQTLFSVFHSFPLSKQIWIVF